METNAVYSRRADFGARILVVDDDAIARRSLRAMLERGHYLVETVGSGAEALKILPVYRPELILLDILMPGMDGLETCRLIRATPGGDLLPVIFLTADERPETHADAFRAKGDDFLRKPVFPTELIVRIRSLMRLKRLQAEVQAERDALIDAQKQREQLFEFIVHDLKNPLATIQVGLDLLSDSPRQRSLRAAAAAADPGDGPEHGPHGPEHPGHRSRRADGAGGPPHPARAPRLAAQPPPGGGVPGPAPEPADGLGRVRPSWRSMRTRI